MFFIKFNYYVFVYFREVYAPPPPRVVKVVNVERNAQPDANTSSNTFVSNVSVNKNGNLFNDIFNVNHLKIYFLFYKELKLKLIFFLISRFLYLLWGQ